uniref:Vacuolar protein sorting-associated protein n=1 Tax=Peronospora matthiolae TaxID=2874970 RepID=A0AAV1T538_9STRA
MLQHAMALLLQRLLGKFVTFDSSMLKLSLWQGDLSFQDLQLRLSYGEGAIGYLSVKIPWRALWTQPVQIKAQGVRVWLHQTPKTSHTEPQESQEPVDTSIEDGHGDDRTYLSKLVSHIIGNVQIEVSDVQIRYDCDPSSLAPRPGSGTLEVGYVSVMNANADWQLEFTLQSNAAMKSNKLLKVEGIAAYVEYPDKESRRGSYCDRVSPDMYRKYLFHEWCSTIKASLYYHSVNAAFPDVELDVDISCEPGNVAEKCSICAAHNTCGTNKYALPVHQPRVHFGREHVDVLYAILIEVRAPYDEYDRLTALTRQQTSRTDGFLMVLSYAKQWLLTDCLDAVVGETFTLEAEDEDGDDDEFEDAITPPSLSVRAQLRHGAGLFFSARESIATGSEVIREAQWIWVLGETIAAVKQSCVEDEIQLSVQSLRMYEVSECSGSYSIIDHASESCDGADSALVKAPIVRMSCVIPAYQSRLIGYQPVLDIRLGSITMFIKDDTLLVWMTLFAPVYLWWNRWNLSHPSTSGACDEDRFAPISHLGIHVERMCLVYALHDQFCFGAELRALSVETFESDHEFVQSIFRSRIRLFSASESLTSIQAQTNLNDVKGLHNIATIDDLSLTTTSHSRMHWSMDHYSCKHCALRDGRLHYEQRELDSNEESAMYRYVAQLSTVQIDWTVSELEALAWVLGKWSFFMPDKAVIRPVQSPNHTVAKSEVILICRTKWSIRTPEIQLRVAENRKGQDAQPSFTLSIKDVEWLSHACTTTYYQSISVASISLREADNETIQVTGKLGLHTPAFRVTLRCDRANPCESQEAEKSLQAVLQSGRQSTRVVFTIQCLYGELFLPNIQVIRVWLGDCYDRYLLGFILSANAGYALDDFRRNLSKLGSEASIKSLKDLPCSNNEVLVRLLVTHGLQLKVKHLDQTPSAALDGLTPIQTIASIKVSSVSVQVSGSGAVCGTVVEVKGSLRNLRLTDLTSPSGSLPTKAKQSNRQSIGSPPDVLDRVSDAGSVGVKNLVDFVVNFPECADNRVMVRVRLDSVCIVYLHRVFKQFYHYIFDHVFELLRNPLM